MNFFVGLWEDVKLFFSDSFDLLWPLIKQFLTDEGKVLVRVAQDVVVKVASDPNYETMTWQEKLAAAVTLAEEELTAQGLTIAKTFIINAIQAVITAQKDQVATDEPAVKTAFISAVASADPDIPYDFNGA
jgi:hypothetical protein